jgi:hypothetical protein
MPITTTSGPTFMVCVITSPPKNMRRLPFKKVFAPAICDGTKRSTLRKTSNLEEGEEVEATWGRYSPVRFATLRVTERSVISYAEITDELAQEDGFCDASSLREALAKLYPGVDSFVLLRFEVVSADGV